MNSHTIRDFSESAAVCAKIERFSKAARIRARPGSDGVAMGGYENETEMETRPRRKSLGVALAVANAWMASATVSAIGHWPGL